MTSRIASEILISGVKDTTPKRKKTSKPSFPISPHRFPIEIHYDDYDFDDEAEQEAQKEESAPVWWSQKKGNIFGTFSCRWSQTPSFLANSYLLGFKNEEFMGDLSTIDGLSIFGEDLDLNMQRAYSNDQERKPSQEETKDNNWNDDFSQSDFCEFKDRDLEEEKIPNIPEDNSYFIEPQFMKATSYPISGSIRGRNFGEESQQNLSSWKSAMNESIDLVNNQDEFDQL